MGPFLIGTVFWSTYYYLNYCDEKLVEEAAAPAGPNDGEHGQQVRPLVNLTLFLPSLPCKAHWITGGVVVLTL